MKTRYITFIMLVAALMLGACSSTPKKNASLEQARSDYSLAQSNPQVTALAGPELKQAGDALDKANDAWSRNEGWSQDKSTAKVDQLAYLAKQRIAIAQETARLRAAEKTSESSAAERNEVRLRARTREADIANRNAEVLRHQSEASLYHADLQEQRAQNAEIRTDELEARLQALQAKKTERGLVVTFGDLLFDVNKAEIKPGGARNVQKLADVLKQYPERNVLIEGFTDNTGDGNYNQNLSSRRVSAVRSSLHGMGIDRHRITGRGYGESYPVATNNTKAGRQLNRRVEVVISDASGQIAPR